MERQQWRATCIVEFVFDCQFHQFHEDTTKNDLRAATPQTCACFIDPDEAKTVLQQAAKAAPDMNLGIGVLPLGKALGHLPKALDALGPHDVSPRLGCD